MKKNIKKVITIATLLLMPISFTGCSSHMEEADVTLESWSEESDNGANMGTENNADNDAGAKDTNVPPEIK